MDQEIMEGIILSYTKILKEIKEINAKIDQMSKTNKKTRKKAPTCPDNATQCAKKQHNKVKNSISRKIGRKTTEKVGIGTVNENNAAVSDFFKNLESSI